MTVSRGKRDIGVKYAEREAEARKAIQTSVIFKKRRCLKCRKMFASRGIENRICMKCTLKNETVSGIREFDVGDDDCLVRRKPIPGG
jgi:hypothetical protein